MSTSSKPKHRAPTHQNKTAFRHNKGSKLTKKIAETANTGGLCPRCAEKIEWRVKYRKYKPLSAPRKCNRCGNHCIKAAYRNICPSCANTPEGRICQGCGDSTRVNGAVPTQAQRNQTYNVNVEHVKHMTERQRRTVYRRVERGENTSSVVREVSGEGPVGDSDDEYDGDLDDEEPDIDAETDEDEPSA